MENENLIIALTQIFKENGLIVLSDEYDDELDIDSIRYISIIVQIEETFDIVIPDELLSGDSLKKFNEYLSLINILLTQA